MSSGALTSWRVFVGRAAALTLGALVMPSSIQCEEVGSAGFEALPTLHASEILPPELLNSEHHRVAEDVANDGYMNRYIVESEFGEFEAYGRTVLALRVQEIQALAELDRLTRTEVFVDAVSRSVMSQVTTVKEFAGRPVATLKGVPKGVKRMFKRVKRQAKEGVGTVMELAQGSDDEMSDGEEPGKLPKEKTKKVLKEGADASQKYARKYLGISGAERRWAEKLGVDPYTSTEVLVREIRRVARVDAGASLAVRLVPIPQIPGVSVLKDVSKLVWRTDQRGLLEHNKKELAKLGVKDEFVENFLANSFYSPTLQTFMVEALGELHGVKDLSVGIVFWRRLPSRPRKLCFPSRPFACWSDFIGRFRLSIASSAGEACRRPSQRMAGWFFWCRLSTYRGPKESLRQLSPPLGGLTGILGRSSAKYGSVVGCRRDVNRNSRSEVGWSSTMFNLRLK